MIMEMSTALSGSYQRSIVSVSRAAELQPATEYDRRQPWNHPESGASAADLSRFLRGKSRYQDTQSTIVFPLNNSSHSLFNLRSWSGVEPVHSYNLEIVPQID